MYKTVVLDRRSVVLAWIHSVIAAPIIFFIDVPGLNGRIPGLLVSFDGVILTLFVSLVSIPIYLKTGVPNALHRKMGKRDGGLQLLWFLVGYSTLLVISAVITVIPVGLIAEYLSAGNYVNTELGVSLIFPIIYLPAVLFSTVLFVLLYLSRNVYVFLRGR